MPTTTEARIFTRKVPIPGLLMVAEAVIGFGSPASMIPAVAGSDGYLLDAGKFYIAARTGPSTVRNLYAAGAWFVWPVIGKGCGRS